MKTNIKLTDYSFYSPKITKTYSNGEDIIKFGEYNDFPSLLLSAVNESPLQSSILASKQNYILGANLKPTKELIRRPNPSETWSDLFEKCVKSYTYFEGFALQAILNKDETHWSFYFQPIEEVRFAPMNSRNQIEKAFLCKNWKRYTNKNIEEIKMFGSEEPKIGEPYLMVFQDFAVGEYYYHIPSYFCGINYILADASLSKYYNNFISNNFSANKVITYPYEVDEDKKQQLYEALKDNFGGSENAGSWLLLFGENGTAPTVASLSTDDADLYNGVNELIRMNLCSANRLVSIVLAGLSSSAGFSSKSDEIIAASVLYKLNVINPCRQFILKNLNNLLAMNGEEKCLEIEDFNLREEFEGSTDENVDKVNDLTTDNNNLQNVDSNE